MKRITKILLLTMLLTLCITSTCFASNVRLPDNINAKFNELISTDGQLTASYYLVTDIKGVNYNYYIYGFEDNNVQFDGTNIKLNCTVRKAYWVSTDSYGNVQADVKDYYNTTRELSIPIDWIAMSTVNLYDTDGNQIFPVPEEDVGGDIMGGETTLSFPEHEYTYWEGVIHENNGTTYAVLLVSNDSFSADNFLYREGSGDTQDTIRFYASAEDVDTNYFVRTYVLQPDGTWLFGSGSSYTGTSMSHNFNVGTVVMTTKNIENVDGTIFFPLTPAETLESLGAKIVEAMAKITIVAVSCLVLLISLQVLLRVLKIYLA